MVKYLLEQGANLEHKTDEMHTALMEASMDGHVDVARYLLDRGAQVTDVHCNDGRFSYKAAFRKHVSNQAGFVGWSFIVYILGFWPSIARCCHLNIGRMIIRRLVSDDK